MIQFTNVIEIAPYSFSKSEWKILEQLPVIRENSFFVNIQNCTDEALKIILKNHLKELESIGDKNSEEDIFYALYGGIVIKIDNQIVLEPQCCSDLNIIEEWTNELEKITKEWKMFWIGHPWVFVRLIDGFIEFSDYENNIEKLETTEPKFKLPQSTLAKALQQLENELTLFEKRLLALLEK
ncbi:MAG: hypothetical protein AB8G11_08855 [Saprospiraceae bacterium]